MKNLILVRGGGDLATGTIYKLKKCGFPVLILETANPSAIQITGTVDTQTPGTYHVGFTLHTPTERPDIYQTYTVYQTVVVR